MLHNHQINGLNKTDDNFDAALDDDTKHTSVLSEEPFHGL